MSFALGLQPTPRGPRSGDEPSSPPPRELRVGSLRRLPLGCRKAGGPPYPSALLFPQPLPQPIHLAHLCRGASGKHQAKRHRVRPSSSCFKGEAPVPRPNQSRRAPYMAPPHGSALPGSKRLRPQGHIEAVCRSQPPHTHIVHAHTHKRVHTCVLSLLSIWVLWVCSRLQSRLEVVGSPRKG